VTNHFSTQAVHAGEEKRKPYGAITTPIIQASTYTFENTAEILDYMHRLAANDPNAGRVWTLRQSDAESSGA